jgi:hypothetical protein
LAGIDTRLVQDPCTTQRSVSQRDRFAPDNIVEHLVPI